MKTRYTLAVLAAVIALLSTPQRAAAQITVADSLSATDVAQLLEGLNLSISNVEVNCPGRAMGHFTGSSELEMAQGLVLTTGSAVGVAGPASYFSSEYLGTPGDADLEADAGFSTNDACVLEFDCIPAGDTLLFNFSFGSEEYPEFVGTAFNDIFAIYLSGPDMPYPVNVAQLPDGTPVAINNVNDMNNSDYYHNNETGQFVSYDGFTENLTAFAVVIPGGSYHFKVAIADASDGIFDSGVFLEAFSFRSVMADPTSVDGTNSPALGVSQNGDHVTFTWPAGQGSSELVVYDAMGRTMLKHAVTGSQFLLDASSLPAGAYSVVLRNNGAMAPVRFVKQ